MFKIFLETHNINNIHSGFGQFNFHLLKAIKDINDPDLEFSVHVRPYNQLKSSFGDYFKYKRYFGARRYKLTSVRKKYDVWHSLNQNTKIEPYHDLPYVLTVHDVNFIQEVSSNLTHERNLRFIEKLKRANAITYISNYAKDSTHKYFDVPDVPEYVIYNGNPLTELEEEISAVKHNIDSPYLYTLGDFLERKNFHLLVEMMPFLPEFKLVISGNDTRPYAEKVKETIAKLNLNDRVILTGRVSEAEKQFYLKHCKAFVFPSQREGFGLPVIEAMRYGKPLFLSNLTSLPEVGGDYAFYWENLSPEYMANFINDKLKVYNTETSTYSKKLKERAASFTWHNAAKQYIEVYKALLNN